MLTWKGKWALITGASAGIGEAFAHALAAKGTNLILIARREQKLQALALALNQNHGVEVKVYMADLAKHDAPRAIYDWVQANHLAVDILINNAGIGVHGSLHETDINKNKSLLYINVLAVSMLSQLFLPMLLANKGILINVASTAAFQPLAYMSNYGASKAFIVSFSEALWAEYHAKGLRVLVVCPGPVSTEFFTAMGSTVDQLGKRDTAENTVNMALAGLERNKMTVITGPARNYWLAHLNRFVPRKWVALIAAKLVASRNK